MNIKKIAQFSIGPLGAGVLSLVTLPFVAWSFSPEDVGRLTMLQVVLSLSVTFFSLAMHQAYVREYYVEHDKEALLKTSLAPGLMFLTFTVLFLTILPFSYSKLIFGIDSYFLTMLLLLGVYSSFFINFLAHLLRMEGRGIAFSATQIAPKFMFLVLVGAIVIFNFRTDSSLLIFMQIVSLVFSAFVFLWLTRQAVIPAVNKKIDISLLKRMLRFSLPLVLGGMAYWGLTAMDRFFLKALVGLEEVGVYAVAASLAASVALVSTIFSNLWHPTVYKWLKDGIEPKNIQAASEIMTLVVAVIWTFFGIFSWVIPAFLPDEYYSVKYLIVACVSMPLFYMLSETTVVGIGISRRSGFSFLASGVALLCNAILNYITIPILGASGAALASVLAFFIFFIVRTESSAYVWQSIPRLKIYVVTILYVLTTIVMVLSEADIESFYLVWVGILALTVLLFTKRIANSFESYKIISFG
ncbi:MAG: oligosaccharide flippase family protein [Actinobacteria bacterium]|nr:oligosaccharide flippase family protein [Actinomycetota bacterium]